MKTLNFLAIYMHTSCLQIIFILITLHCMWTYQIMNFKVIQTMMFFSISWYALSSSFLKELRTKDWYLTYIIILSKRWTSMIRANFFRHQKAINYSQTFKTISKFWWIFLFVEWVGTLFNIWSYQFCQIADIIELHSTYLNLCENPFICSVINVVTYANHHN